jgi:hypothetical protein
VLRGGADTLETGVALYWGLVLWDGAGTPRREWYSELGPGAPAWGWYSETGVALYWGLVLRGGAGTLRREWHFTGVATDVSEEHIASTFRVEEIIPEEPTSK